MNLKGKVPDSLQYCRSLQTLDLSGNYLSGPIPSDICNWLPFLVTLDLSNNEFSGSIPADLVKCSYLNKLMHNDNKLNGNIPSQFSSLGRLKIFSVAKNDLKGRIPEAFDSGGSFDFGGNGLCGGPLGKCGGLSKKKLAIIIAAALELATGQRPLEVAADDEGFKGNLVDWVNQLSVSGRIKDAIDKHMCGKRHDEEIVQFLKIACNCVISGPKERVQQSHLMHEWKSITRCFTFGEYKCILWNATKQVNGNYPF
ncbi:hypothetical protein K7X08_017538 [Anisodus acutangulus]|uniref:Uncharacterized protein n=1 Tax=Anisodus acutangulus TaxID=402998 RepID=A0A9Q1LWP5_9SOLA|nr:hypothetical protein K7X08_017538 [Anisodus acutangulus]